MRHVTSRQLIDAFIDRREVVYGGFFEPLRCGDLALYDLDLYVDMHRGRVWEYVAWHEGNVCIIDLDSFPSSPRQLLISELDRLGIEWRYK